MLPYCSQLLAVASVATTSAIPNPLESRHQLNVDTGSYQPIAEERVL